MSDKKQLFDTKELKKKKLSDLEFEELGKISPAFEVLKNYQGEHGDAAFNFMKKFFNQTVKPLLKAIEDNVDEEVSNKIIKDE